MLACLAGVFPDDPQAILDEVGKRRSSQLFPNSFALSQMHLRVSLWLPQPVAWLPRTAGVASPLFWGHFNCALDVAARRDAQNSC